MEVLYHSQTLHRMIKEGLCRKLCIQTIKTLTWNWPWIRDIAGPHREVSNDFQEIDHRTRFTFKLFPILILMFS